MASQSCTFLPFFLPAIFLRLATFRYFNSSVTHPTSGAASAFSKVLPLLSLSNIFALRALPDSTLSAGSTSSSHLASPHIIVLAVGVDGRLQKPALNPANALGEANPPLPTCNPQELGADLALLSCNCLSDATISFTDEPACHEPSCAPLGDIGGDSVGGELGGEIRTDVGEETRFLGI